MLLRHLRPSAARSLVTLTLPQARTMSSAGLTSSSTAQPSTSASSSSSTSPPPEPRSSAAANTPPPPPPSKFSVFGEGITQVHDVPMSVITRPVPSILDEAKVKTFMEEIERGDTFTPIEVLRVKNPKNEAQSYYFSLGGCHRYEAHKRLRKETIPGKIINVPASTMRTYLGAGAPF